MLAGYPERAAATRFRLLPVMDELARRGVSSDLRTFLSQADFAGFYEEPLRQAKATVRGIVRQLSAVRARCDAVLVQREAMLIGPPLVEALLGRKIPMFFDFDDAIWLSDTDRTTTRGRLRSLVRRPEKFWYAARRARHVFAGSETLAGVARKVSANVSVVPSVVSRDAWQPLPERLSGSLPDVPVVGWVGTHSTAPQLEMVLPSLIQLRQEGLLFRVRVVGAGRDFRLRGLEAEYAPWTPERDVTDFQELDVGLAPMFSDEWSEGKCAFKQIQYMAVGVPCVSSMVGGARDFVRHGENALVAASQDEWTAAIRSLLTDVELRRRIAVAGRALIESRLCSEVQASRVADRIESVLR